MRFQPFKSMGIAVIETRWWPHRNASVRAIFDILSESWCQHNHGYFYEQFGNAASLKEVMLRASAKRNIHALYLAGHGLPKGIQGSNEKLIPRRTIRDVLRRVAENGCRKTKGLFVGACHFTNADTAEFILKSGSTRDHNVIWLAGYDRSADWVVSSSVDLLFWQYYLETVRPHRAEITRIRKTAAKLEKMMPGIAGLAGFNIWIRSPDGRGVRPLLPVA